MKYKVGDKVKIRSDLEVDRYYGKEVFTGDMKNFLGKELCIYKASGGLYYFSEDNEFWRWTDEMFEGLVEGNKEKHKGCEFCNDDFYRAFTEKNGTIKFNKVKMLNIVVCITDMEEKIIAIVNSDERIKPDSKVKIKLKEKDKKEWGYLDARVVSSLKILKKYYEHFYAAVHLTRLKDNLLDIEAEVVGVYKQETKIVEKEEIVETLEEI